MPRDDCVTPPSLNAQEQVVGAGERVWRAQTRDGHVIELVDATRPPERALRRVFGLSVLVGCPVKCTMCDAGGGYLGKLEAGELFEQLDFLVETTGGRDVPELRVELTRMGEPAFNPEVLTFLRGLPGRYPWARVEALVSSVGPARCEAFFEELLEVKAAHFPSGGLTAQLSMHTTDEQVRRTVVPIKCWGFDAMAAWGERFARAGGPKVVLHFPVAQHLPIDASALAQRFSPEWFAVKLSPITPTEAASRAGLFTADAARLDALAQALTERGFQVVRTETPAEQADACGRFFSAPPQLGTPRRTLRPHHERD